MNLSLWVMNEFRYISASVKVLYSISISIFTLLSFYIISVLSSQAIRKFLQNKYDPTSHFSTREFDIQCFSLSLPTLGALQAEQQLRNTSNRNSLRFSICFLGRFSVWIRDLLISRPSSFSDSKNYLTLFIRSLMDVFLSLSSSSLNLSSGQVIWQIFLSYSKDSAKSFLKAGSFVRMEVSNFHSMETVFWMSRMEALLVWLAMLRNSKVSSESSLESFSMSPHLRAEILLFLDLIFSIFSWNLESSSRASLGTNTRVFCTNLMILPKWLLTKAKALLSFRSSLILFLLQKIIILALHCSCFMYLSSSILSSQLQMMKGEINFLVLMQELRFVKPWHEMLLASSSFLICSNFTLSQCLSMISRELVIDFSMRYPFFNVRMVLNRQLRLGSQFLGRLTSFTRWMQSFFSKYLVRFLISVSAASTVTQKKQVVSLITLSRLLKGLISSENFYIWYWISSQSEIPLVQKQALLHLTVLHVMNLSSYFISWVMSRQLLEVLQTSGAQDSLLSKVQQQMTLILVFLASQTTSRWQIQLVTINYGMLCPTDCSSSWKLLQNSKLMLALARAAQKMVSSDVLGPGLLSILTEQAFQLFLFCQLFFRCLLSLFYCRTWMSSVQFSTSRTLKGRLSSILAPRSTTQMLGLKLIFWRLFLSYLQFSTHVTTLLQQRLRNYSKKQSRETKQSQSMLLWPISFLMDSFSGFMKVESMTLTLTWEEGAPLASCDDSQPIGLLSKSSILQKFHNPKVFKHDSQLQGISN